MDPSQREVRTKLYFSYLHHVVFAPEAEQHSLLRSARAAKNMFEPYILFKLWDYNFAYVTTHTRTSRSWGARAGPHAALLPAPAAHSPHASTPDPHYGPSDTRPACLTVVASARLPSGSSHGNLPADLGRLARRRAFALKPLNRETESVNAFVIPDIF